MGSGVSKVQKYWAAVVACAFALGSSACFRTENATLRNGTSLARNLSTNASGNGIIVNAYIPQATLAPGQTLQAFSNVVINGVSNPSALVTWTSSNPSIATVSPTGLITGVSASSSPVIIAAGYNGVLGQVALIVGTSGSGGGGSTITIRQGSQVVSGGSITLALGAATTLSAVLLDSNGALAPNQPTFTWNSSSGSVSVGSGGFIVGNGVGTAIVSALASGYTPATVAVSVTGGGSGGALAGVRILQNGQNVSGQVLSLAQGSTLNLNAVGVDSNGAAVSQQPLFTWSPASGAAASVSNGVVTGNSVGTQQITLSGGGFSAVATINVTTSGSGGGGVLKKIKITAASGTDLTNQTSYIPAQAGLTYVLTASLVDSNGTVLPDPAGGYKWVLNNPGTTADFNCGANCKTATFSINASSGGKWFVDASVTDDPSILKSSVTFDAGTACTTGICHVVIYHSGLQPPSNATTVPLTNLGTGNPVLSLQNQIPFFAACFNSSLLLIGRSDSANPNGCTPTWSNVTPSLWELSGGTAGSTGTLKALAFGLSKIEARIAGIPAVGVLVGHIYNVTSKISATISHNQVPYPAGSSFRIGARVEYAANPHNGTNYPLSSSASLRCINVSGQGCSKIQMCPAVTQGGLIFPGAGGGGPVYASPYCDITLGSNFGITAGAPEIVEFEVKEHNLTTQAPGELANNLGVKNIRIMGCSPNNVDTLTMTPNGNMTLAAGTTYQLSAVAKDSSGNTISNPALTWISTDPTKVAVSSTGMISALTGQGARIHVYSGCASSPQMMDIAVSGAAPSIRLKRGTSAFTGTLDLLPNSPVSITAEAYDGSGVKVPGQPTFNFVSSNPSAITVVNTSTNSVGVITGVQPKQTGTVTISAAGYPSAVIPVQVSDSYLLQLRVNVSGNWTDPWLGTGSSTLSLDEKNTYLFSARVVDASGNLPAGLTQPGAADYAFTAPNFATSTLASGSFRSNVPGTSLLTASVEFPKGSGLRIQNSVPLDFKAAGVATDISEIYNPLLRPGNSITCSAGGFYHNLFAVLAPAGAVGNVTWSSSNPAVVALMPDPADSKHVVVDCRPSLSAGSAVITASLVGTTKSASFNFNVLAGSTSSYTGVVGGITISATPLSLPIGQSTQVAHAFKDSSGALLSEIYVQDRPLSFKSSDPTVVSVTTDGLARALKSGSAVITAEVHRDRTLSSKVTSNPLTFNVPASLSGYTIGIVQPASTNLVVNENRVLTAILKDANGNIVTSPTGVSWSIISGNANGSISPNGFSATIYGDACGSFMVQANYTPPGSNQPTSTDEMNFIVGSTLLGAECGPE